jgi:hypothetical protein
MQQSELVMLQSKLVDLLKRREKELLKLERELVTRIKLNIVHHSMLKKEIAQLQEDIEKETAQLQEDIEKEKKSCHEADI